MEPRPPLCYSQASPAPERVPRPIMVELLCPTFLKPSVGASMSGSHARPWDPSRALADAREKRRAYFSAGKKPATQPKFDSRLERTSAWDITHRRSRLAARERVFTPRQRGRRNAGLRRNSRPLAAASTAAPAPRLQSAARRPLPAQTSQLSAWKSAQELARRLRKRRAAKDDGLARQFRTASTHGRCCHR